jgi:hypothetical protein
LRRALVIQIILAGEPGWRAIATKRDGGRQSLPPNRRKPMTTATKPSQQNEKHQLHDEELDAVSGGLPVTKAFDKASPSLFSTCCTGKHFS